MRCNRVAHLLPAYLDGDLLGRLNQAVSDHLDACECCRRELAAQQRVHRILDTGRPPVTIDLWADFSRRLQAESPPRPSPWRALCQPGFATALAVAVVALIARTAPVPAFAPSAGGSPGPAVQMARVPALEGGDVREFGRATRLQRSRPGGAPHLVMPASVPNRAPARLRAKRPLLVADGMGSGRRTRAAWRFQPARGVRPHSFAPSSPIWLTVASRPKLPDTGLVESPIRAQESADHRQVPAPTAPPIAASVAPQTARSQANAARHHSGDPLQIAEALASVQQDAASDQMGGELLRLAREVARVGGEPIPAERSGVQSAAPAADSTAATGT